MLVSFQTLGAFFPLSEEWCQAEVRPGVRARGRRVPKHWALNVECWLLNVFRGLWGGAVTSKRWMHSAQDREPVRVAGVRLQSRSVTAGAI